MAWSHDVGLRDGTATITGGEAGAEPEYVRWERIPINKRTLLETAVRVAPDMVEAAIDALTDYCNRCDVKGASDVDAMREEAWIGLAKYFCLTDTSSASYWERVAQIRGIFYKIALGMSTSTGSKDAYVVDLSNFGQSNSGAEGGVSFKGAGNAGVSPIRAAFGFQDEWGHSPCLWRFMEGPIKLNTKFIALPPKGQETAKAHELARIIVHEGSHKWAQTKDILYKVSSHGSAINEFYRAREKPLGTFAFKMKRQEMEKAVKEPRPQNSLPSDADVLQEMMGSYFREKWDEIKVQEASVAVAMPDRNKVRGVLGTPKKLVKMAGTSPMAWDLTPKGTDPIADERWLENADSYAWFARRMWKRAMTNRV